MKTVKAMPHAVDLERYLLGGIMKDGRSAIMQVEHIAAEDFWRHDHAELFKLLCEMDALGEDVNNATVPERIAATHEPERYGGFAYVLELSGCNVTTVNLKLYADEITKLALRRRLIAAMQTNIERLYVETENPVGIIDDLHSVVNSELTQSGQTGWVNVCDAIDDFVFDLDEQLAKPEDERTAVGLSTGYRDLDRVSVGMGGGDLIIVAARPSMGKTALALNIARRVSARGQGTTAIFSLEMGKRQLIQRMFAEDSMVSLSNIRAIRLNEQERDLVGLSHGRLRQLRMVIRCDTKITVEGVCAKSKRLMDATGDLQLVVVDYLQLLTASDRRMPREQQVAHMSKTLKGLALDLDIPVMLLCQLNRSCESTKDKRPEVQHLRESGAIEQDADQVWLLYRPEHYWPEDEKTRRKAEIIIPKNRNGKTGVSYLEWKGGTQRFETASVYDQTNWMECE